MVHRIHLKVWKQRIFKHIFLSIEHAVFSGVQVNVAFSVNIVYFHLLSFIQSLKLTSQHHYHYTHHHTHLKSTFLYLRGLDRIYSRSIFYNQMPFLLPPFMSLYFLHDQTCSYRILEINDITCVTVTHIYN